MTDGSGTARRGTGGTGRQAARALVVAHGHPREGIGGGELAAWSLFCALREGGGIDAAFLARTGSPGVAPGAIVSAGEGEHLWRRDIADWFLLSGEGDMAGFTAFLRETAPDVVFVHHYVHLGIEILAVIREALPAARLVLTLHDFVAPCHNGGTMTKRGFERLPCERAMPAACHACFPERPVDAFAARHAALLEGLRAVDRFVAPSRFLARRYVEWGLPAERMAVIENGLEPMAEAAATSPCVPDDDRLRLGFFGQAREAKGLDILLRALHLLRPQERTRLVLDVNASRLEAQPAWYRTLVERLREPLIGEGSVRWPGAYRRDELPGRMAGLDAVVVPSTWWENAPIVIQEAFRFGIPIIGANHGGIAEKVRNGIDGVLFEPRDPAALAELLRRIMAEPASCRGLAANIRPPFTRGEMAAAYLDLAAEGQGRAAA